MVYQNRVRLYRNRLGFTQQCLADYVGISRNALVNIENSKSLPRVNIAIRLAFFLDCKVEDLFPRDFCFNEFEGCLEL